MANDFKIHPSLSKAIARYLLDHCGLKHDDIVDCLGVTSAMAKRIVNGKSSFHRTPKKNL